MQRGTQCMGRETYLATCDKHIIALRTSAPLFSTRETWSDHQEETVHEDIKEERGEVIARVVVVPEADLDWNDDGCVQQEESAHEEHHCAHSK